MKRLALLLIILIISAAHTTAARMYPATGRVIDEQGNAVEYATVVLLRGTEQVTGMATDTEGRFELKVPTGDYTISIQFLGYEPLTHPVRVEQLNDLGEFVLKSAATRIEGVVVKGQLVRREADRFVVDVANAVAAIGKNGVELLEHAPGIWISDDKISINGKTGSKVYVNDRELRMDNDQLLVYLRSLQAENIQKIEIVPTAGADYDADSAGGIIRITLRKRRDNGTEGNVTFNSRHGKYIHNYVPSFRINHHAGRLDLYGSGWATIENSDMYSDENTRYATEGTSLKSHSAMIGKNRNFGADLGTVYQLNDNHSIGAAFEYWRNNEKGPNDTYTDFVAGEVPTRTDSRYDNSTLRNNYTITLNYIWKIDTLGSTLKLLADYDRRQSDAGNNNRSRITSPEHTLDSLYRDHAATVYNVTTATLAYEKHFSPRWSLRTGAKYTFNDMRNDALYEYRKEGTWTRNDNQSFELDYTENIVAAYGIVAAELGRWSLTGGLRGEYTHTYGKGGAVAQDYFSLFPNANISYKLSKDGAYSVIAQYARTIERPRFWSLNPQRQQISDYTYQTGNPYLDPAYKQDVSLTFVLKRKYTLSAGLTLVNDEINQAIQPDADDPNRLQVAWVNYDRTQNYYVSANLPFQPTKWWSLNVNATYIRQGQRIDRHAPQRNYNSAMVNASTTFTLPAKFYIDLSYAFQSRMQLGNCWVEPSHRLSAAVKKRFGEKFTASFSVRSLLDEGQQLGARGEGFVRTVNVGMPWCNRSYQIGVTYNFKSGKAFKRKSVEEASGDAKSRL